MDYPNQTAERQARDQIGKKLIQASWVIQDKKHSKQKIYNTGHTYCHSFTKQPRKRRNITSENLQAADTKGSRGAQDKPFFWLINPAQDKPCKKQ